MCNLRQAGACQEASARDHPPARDCLRARDGDAEWARRVRRRAEEARRARRRSGKGEAMTYDARPALGFALVAAAFCATVVIEVWCRP